MFPYIGIFDVFTAEAKSMSAISLKGRKAKALYDFQGENEDELSFKVRMCIFVSTFEVSSIDK